MDNFLSGHFRTHILPRYYRTNWNKFYCKKSFSLQIVSSTDSLGLYPVSLFEFAIPCPTTRSVSVYLTIQNCVYIRTFEVLPLPITSLLPIVLFPALGVASTNDTALVYMKVRIFFLFGLADLVESLIGWFRGVFLWLD